MAPPACTKVFADFDLLEDILLHLPLQDLFLTQEVCKQWQSMQQTSTRVRKALFLEPFHSQKVYYPSTYKPHWYRVPDRRELLKEGFLSEEDDDEHVSYSTAPIPDETIPGSGSSDEYDEYDSDDSNGSGGSDVTIVNVNMDKYRKQQAAKSKQQDVLGSSHLYDPNMVNPDTMIPKGPPADKKMAVARIVSGPFMNPFADLFCKSSPPSPLSAKQHTRLTSSFNLVTRFWKSARATWWPRPDSYYPNPNYILDRDRENFLVPPRRYDDGTIHGSSHRTHAVERFSASWRKMAPFSAAVTSFRVECFDFDTLEIWCDEGLTAGDMMEQIGHHWSFDCRDCCIYDFWFSEFLKYCKYTDRGWQNRGNHGVQKLGLDNTGWDALSKMYEADTVAITGVWDGQRPY